MSRRSVPNVMWPLMPLVPLYGAAQALDSLSYFRGWRQTARLQWPVVSIGNLSVGGAGKTPFVIALARALTERGWSVDVLSRGYGRDSQEIVRVMADDAEDPAARYGDEPSLIAQDAGVPVFVGRERFAAGQLAEQSMEQESASRHVHLLDDGMQHRALERNAEIVLLHRTDFATTLLPAGRLREPLAALERADFVVLRVEDEELADRARRWMRPDAQLWRIERELDVPVLPGPAVAFCAIAHPEEFLNGLRHKGAAVVASHTWRDHHRFTDADVTLLCDLVTKQKAASLLTTKKDLVRLKRAQRARLEQAAPLLTAGLRIRLLEPGPALTALEKRLLNGA